MHLHEMAALRTKPAAGLFMALTRRCPLSCAHCSTTSSMTSEQYGEEPFRAIAGSFTAESHPGVLLLSGGEALLRPELVGDLAEVARRAGTKSYVLSGMYFAREDHRLPAPVRRALGKVDHLAASLDEFHEKEVSRAQVFRALHEIRELVPGVSFQLTGRDEADPYLAGLVEDVRKEFDDTVPILVGFVSQVGRGRTLSGALPIDRSSTAAEVTADPCDRASWPLVHYDGTVFACCNQDLVERVRPPHLIVGDAATDSWEVIRRRFLDRAVLRTIRVLGPSFIANKFRPEISDIRGMCGTCVALVKPEDTTGEGIEQQLAAYLATPQGAALEAAARELVDAQDPTGFSVRRTQRYGELVTLGWEG